MYTVVYTTIPVYVIQLRATRPATYLVVKYFSQNFFSYLKISFKKKSG